LASAAVAGDEVHHFDGLLAVLGDGTEQLRDLSGTVELDPWRSQCDLDGAPRPAAVVRAHGRHRGDSGPGQLLQLPLERGHVGLTVITWSAPVGDELTHRGEPRTENPVEDLGADQGEGAPEGGLLR
jgi:hypothetical protein